MYKPNINLPVLLLIQNNICLMYLQVVFLNFEVNAECIIMATGVCMIILCHFTI